VGHDIPITEPVHTRFGSGQWRNILVSFRCILDTMLKTRIVASVLGLLLVLGVAAIAQRPEKDISAARHPNLAAAQDLSRRAWQRIVDAQKANEWDMDGHAQKAKDLLDEVNRELRIAATAANRNAR
jgi:hypothetical protein